MEQISEFITSNILPLLVTFLTGIFSYLGMKLKKIIDKEVLKKQVDYIVTTTVNYVEQVSKKELMTSDEKFIKAKEKIIEWLNQEKLIISDTEIDILIESAVKKLT